MNPFDITHAQLVQNLAKSGIEIAANLTPTQADIWHMGTGIAGEAGELLGAIKRFAVYQQKLDRENVIEEMGDIEFFMEHLRQLISVTREEIIDANKAKLLKRYPDGTYTDMHARFRLDKADEQHAFEGNDEGPCLICTHPLQHGIHII